MNILGRKGQIEDLQKELKEIGNKIQKLIDDKKEYEANSDKYEEELEILRQELQEVHVTYATDKQKVLAVEENLQKLRERIDKAKAESLEIEEEKQNNINKKKEFNEFLEKQGEAMQKLKLEIDEFAKLNSDNQKYIDDLKFDVTNLKVSVSSFDESELSIDEMVERINQDIENNKSSIENKKSNMQNILKENEELANKILEYENAIKELDEKMLNSDEGVIKLKEERSEKNKKLEKSEEEISSKMQTLDGLKEEIIKIGVKKDKVKDDIYRDTNKLLEEYELTPRIAEGAFKRPENIAVATKNVNALRLKIKDLGNVNINSIEEYKEVSKRYDFMCEQRLDIENTMAKLKNVIQEMLDTMKKQFIKQFRLINTNFADVFKELFGGGRASLILEDENNVLECGIEIIVQPPGKKLQNMTLLSRRRKSIHSNCIAFCNA